VTLLDDADDFDGTFGEQYDVRDDMRRAIERAHSIQRELAGSVPGVLADFLRDVREEATDAAIELMMVHPDHSAKVFELQKTVMPYARLMRWIAESLADGAAGEQMEDEQPEE
jgi:hypothetical protein